MFCDGTKPKSQREHGHRIKISNRRATQLCNVSSFFYAKICSLLARRRSSQPVQWRPTCVMRHARGQKLQSFRRKWPFYMDLYSMTWLKSLSNSIQRTCSQAIFVENKGAPRPLYTSQVERTVQRSRTRNLECLFSNSNMINDKYTTDNLCQRHCKLNQ